VPASLEVRAYIRDRGQPDSLRLGVRATEVSVLPSEHETHNVPGEVYVTETLGHRNILTAKLGNDLVQVVTLPEFVFKVRDTVWLDLSPANVHVFSDGLAIAHPKHQAG
jgi:ABC-type sugar transport system ATPase subunit